MTVSAAQSRSVQAGDQQGAVTVSAAHYRSAQAGDQQGAATVHAAHYRYVVKSLAAPAGHHVLPTLK